ncbi:MAG TPA: translation initiation factor IF-2 [Anaeromyxobacteraceae bacterium]|nr:translation initiation factor IF-2 [Anaeromyxobacteraceae bacterium]
MASKEIHPGQDKAALRQQAAGERRGAPGKRFIGGTAEQSAAARRSTRKKVGRMAEIDAAERRAAELGEPVSAIVAELIADALKLGRALAAAPFRIAAAVRHRPRPVA